jgi:hypothetical protein
LRIRLTCARMKVGQRCISSSLKGPIPDPGLFTQSCVKISVLLGEVMV